MKDRNFLSCKKRRFSQGTPGLVQFDAKYDIKEIISECQKDVEFMKNMKFMDYSLLFAVERIKDVKFEEKGLDES